MSAASSVVSVELPGGELVEAEVYRSSRARVTRIQLGADRPLRVIVPEGASDEFAVDALRAKGAWVQGKLRAVEQAVTRRSELGLNRPGFVWDGGRAVRIESADVPFARRRGDVLEVPRHGSAAAVERWYRRQARSYLLRLVRQEVARLELMPKRVAVRDQRTRWGSCSSQGTLSLNWRLLLVPEDVARYVVIHELVHLDIPNHSKAFWRTLGNACPSWQQASAWLREHGDEVRHYRFL